MRESLAGSSKYMLKVLLALAVAACFLFLVYEPRAARSIQESDGPEMLLSALKGSLVHPPGYPLYTSLAYVWVRLFPCNPYYSLAIFSALCQAATVGLLVIVLSHLARSVLLGTTLAVAWGLFEPTVRTAIDAEVFALHHLLAVSLAATLIFIREFPGRRKPLWIVFSVLLGLAAAHQHLIVLLFPFLFGLALEVETERSEKPPWRKVFLIAAGVAAALYLSLFLRYRHAPLLAFAPLESAYDFLSYLLRGGYGTFSLFLPDGEPTVSFTGIVYTMILASLPAAVLLTLIQLLYGVSKRTALWWGVVGSLGLAALFSRGLVLPQSGAGLSDWMMRFYPSIAMVPLLAAAVGFSYLRWGRTPAALVLSGLSLMALWIQAPGTLARADLSQDKRVEDEVLDGLLLAPSDAVLIVSSDRLVFGMTLKQKAYSLRPDVDIIAVGLLESDFYRRRVAALLKDPPGQDLERLRDPAIVASLARANGRPVLTEQFLVAATGADPLPRKSLEVTP